MVNIIEVEKPNGPNLQSFQVQLMHSNIPCRIETAWLRAANYHSELQNICARTNGEQASTGSHRILVRYIG